MTDNDLIIIGAGLSGLSAGIYAQLGGYRSLILEHHSQAGGVAASWDRGDYLIDGGIHFAMGHKPDTGLYEMYEQLGIVPANRFVPMPDFGRYVHEPSGHRIDVTGDLDQLRSDLLDMSPDDGELIDTVLRSARAMSGIDMSTIGLAKPPELAGRLDTLRELWAMRRLLRQFTGTNAQPITDFAGQARDPRLQDFLERLFVPEAPVYFIGMLLAMAADGEMAFIEGGCRDFVGAMERRYAELGGEIAFDSTVERILVEDDRAVGVRLTDGAEHRAGAVVSAADGYSTIFDMLGGRYVSDLIREQYESWELFKPLVMVSFGVTRTFEGEPAFTTVRLEQPFVVGPDVVDNVFIRLFNYSDRFAPTGKSVVQLHLETDWDYWHDLHGGGADAYSQEKDRIAAFALERLDALYPGLSADVEVTDVVTPITIWRYTRNYRASWEGWLMTPKQIQARVPRTLPGLARFYMAGQWVMPGGGVVPCLYSGKHAIQILSRDMPPSQPGRLEERP